MIVQLNKTIGWIMDTVDHYSLNAPYYNIGIENMMFGILGLFFKI